MASNKSTKKNELTYMQVPLPKSRKKYRTVKVDWSGLNYRQCMDTGALSYEKNISTDEAPYLVPSERVSEKLAYQGDNSKVLKIYPWKDKIGIVFEEANKLFTQLYTANSWDTFGEEAEVSKTDYSFAGECSVCTFDTSFTYENVDPDYKDRLLFFPGAYSLAYPIIITVPYISGFVGGNSPGIPKFIAQFSNKEYNYNVVETSAKVPESYKEDYYIGDNRMTLTRDDVLSIWHHSQPNVIGALWFPKYTPAFTAGEITDAPKMRYVTVFQSRLFGIGNNKVYASGFGDYANWILDSADNISAENAWESNLSANPEADGELTAITAYQDRVVIFRENYMYEIRNTKNPFRVVDIFNEGCVSPGGYAVVNGLLLFASKYGVRMYTGAKPKDIGYQLGINRIYYACSGTDGVKWYLYCHTDRKDHNLFVYDTVTGLWSEMELDKRIISFAKTDSGLFMLDDNNTIYRVDSGDYSGVDWAAETDFYSGSSIDIKHIRKIQTLAELGAGSTVNIHLLCDDESFDSLSDEERAERLLYTKTNSGENTETAVIRFVPRKTANYRYKVRISGTGYSKIYQMEVTTSAGGELFHGE